MPWSQGPTPCAILVVGLLLHASHCLTLPSHARIQPRIEERPRITKTSIGSPISGELLVTIPIEIFIPSIKKRSKRSTTAEPLLQKKQTMQNNLASWFGIDDNSCQKQFICQLMEHPQKYAPLSTFIYLKDYSEKDRFSCEPTSCKTPMNEWIDMNILRYWQLISQYTPVTISI